MALKLSCAFATAMDTPDHVAVAESLGYGRAWLYDSPPLYPDVWVQLARAAERTTTIGLGPGVLIPSLRHPMVTAAATATLVDLAGEGRVAVGVGSGFTGRFTLGQKPLRWADVSHYVRVVRALLRGEVTEWEGAKVQMLQPDGFGAPRPIEVPFVIGAAGPKGMEAAHAVGDGVITSGGSDVSEFDWAVCLFFGTVLDEGESVDSPRVMAAAGHGAAVSYHFAHEHGISGHGPPDAEQWAAAYDDVAPEVRHLAMHEGHLVSVNERDRPFVTPELIAAVGGAYDPGQLRDRCATLEAAGVTEIAYQPAGPDIGRELEVFAAAMAR